MSSLFQNTSQAKNYAAFRPTYPSALYRKIVAETHDDQKLCIDVGCGTGQASCALAEFFDHVIGIDPSQSQLDHAMPHSKVSYQQGFCNKLPAKNASVSLVAVAQAAHWFDLPAFYKEVDRVVKPGGVLAMWAYGNQQFPQHAELEQRIMVDLYEDTLGPYWDDRRKIVEGLYEDIPFISGNFTTNWFVDGLQMTKQMKREQLLGYLRSWSAYAKYCKEFDITEQEAQDPVQRIGTWMQSRKDIPDEIVTSWPIGLLLSVKHGDSSTDGT